MELKKEYEKTMDRLVGRVKDKCLSEVDRLIEDTYSKDLRKSDATYLEKASYFFENYRLEIEVKPVERRENSYIDIKLRATSLNQVRVCERYFPMTDTTDGSTIDLKQ